MQIIRLTEEEKERIQSLQKPDQILLQTLFDVVIVRQWIMIVLFSRIQEGSVNSDKAIVIMVIEVLWVLSNTSGYLFFS